MFNETNTTLTLSQNDATLGIALFLCTLLFWVGFKDKTFWLLAGPAWIISAIAFLMPYGQVFMVMGVGLGIVLLMRGAYDVYN